MSWIAATDPLALVAIQAGQVGTPSTEAAAAGGNTLDTKQRATEIGEPVPIVFCRRRNDAGGVLISPGATEARFENDTSNAVTAFYHLVLSEGRISSIEVKDVFQGPCRVGSHSQTYDRRAGTWTPENAIVQREGFTKPEASYYCGSVGNYPDMSTLSFRITAPNGSDAWSKQVHCFIRGGLWVPRLFDNTTGPSDNFADLVRWMLLNSGRLQAALLDTPALTAAAQFLEQNRFRCNCSITKSTNYSDLMVKWAPGFLLTESNTAGKRGLRPLLPTTSTGAINTGAITPVYTFTEDHVDNGSVEIQYTSLADRRPFVAQMIWRQQPDDDFGIIRTAEVRYQNTAPNGPYESHDLSEFCCNENHAVKVGAYILAKRRYTSHTIRFTALPQANNTVVVSGSIIRVRLARNTTTAGLAYHDFLYQVERITKTLAGDLSYECTHFPIDSQGRSLIALDVANTVGTGIILSNNKTGLGCDINSKTDTTVPAETFTPPGLDTGGISIGAGGLEAPPGEVGVNPNDGLGGSGVILPHTIYPQGAPPVPGAALDPGVDATCGVNQARSLEWYKDGRKLVTYEFNGSNPPTITYASGDRIPSWTNSLKGILPVQTGDDGSVYRSVIVCTNGTTTTKETLIQSPGAGVSPAQSLISPNPFFSGQCGDSRFAIAVGTTSGGSVWNVPAGGIPSWDVTPFTGDDGRPDTAMNLMVVNCAGERTALGLFISSTNRFGTPVMELTRLDTRANSNSPWSPAIFYTGF